MYFIVRSDASEALLQDAEPRKAGMWLCPGRVIVLLAGKFLLDRKNNVQEFEFTKLIRRCPIPFLGKLVCAKIGCLFFVTSQLRIPNECYAPENDGSCRCCWNKWKDHFMPLKFERQCGRVANPSASL